ncbi:MAG: hypothetical protein AUH07_03000 [Gemmatimonadetes bacterium 13_2_20CM_70_9]|nr:MAG: hypothetical protein AUH07_03000 [Gemmatimonadetes bacterium 13_2_20CM_70_9]
MSADPLFDRLARALAGRYTLVRELGQGGMATVYLGTDLKLGRQVAIKALPPTTRAYLGSGRFQREVLLAAQLSHPHIVPLFEADEADGILFYVMGYVEGESLEDRLAREGPLPLADALRIAAEVGDALQYAHEVGVLHRDVKPANILLSRAHAMVADFGIAKLMEQVKGGQSSLTGAGLTPGTAEYMSPEQAGGAERLDARSDVYALAAVLYEMLVGEPPFTGPSVQAIVARVLTERPRPPRTVRPQVPPHVEHAIASGLAKVPADRPPSARAFVDLLTQPAAGRWRPTRRQLAVTALGAAGIVAAALGIRGVTRRPHPPPEMALVPAGRYPVGGAPWREASTVRLGSFYIDSTEVTVGAYRRYLDSTLGMPPWTGRPPERWPATGVFWVEAVAYCAWRQPGGRLPTEDEWEAAARGPEGLRYPWGDKWVRGFANADSQRDGFAPAGADSLGRSWVGAVDLIGNAWEWTATEAPGPKGELGHIIKGGAFDSPPQNAVAAFRAAFPDRPPRLVHTGFRCAQSVGAQPAPVPLPASVAVLYFESPDSADAYLADGLTEAIITRLGRVERFTVKSRNAVRRFRGTSTDDPAALGRALGVTYLVSGSVRRTGQRGLHVSVELARAATGVHVWGAQYDRGDRALQAVEAEAARAVATALGGALAPAEQTALAPRSTPDPGAYDHFLRGNYELAQRTPRAVGRAIQEYQTAARLDPGYTPALARVALGYALFLDWGWPYAGLAPDGVLGRGEAAVDAALQQDSASADAWMARGFLMTFRNPRTFVGVREALQRAVVLDERNAEVYHQYGMALLWLGQDSAAAEMYHKALAREAERPITLFNLGRVALRQNRYRDAQRWADSTLAFDPAADYGYVLRALAELRLGNHVDARVDAETAVRLHAGFRVPAEAVVALAALQAGDSVGARARVERLEREARAANAPTITDAAWVGRALVALGERQRALDLLERVRPRGARLWFYLRAPEFDPVRTDPRFQELLEESRPQ